MFGNTAANNNYSASYCFDCQCVDALQIYKQTRIIIMIILRVFGTTFAHLMYMGKSWL